METLPISLLRHRSRRRRCLGILALTALIGAVRSGFAADAASEMAGFSVFNQVDLGQLKGEAKAVRGGPMNTARDLAVETCWVASGTPAQQLQALQRVNPAAQAEQKIYLHGNGSNFARLAQAPSNAAVQWLANATLSKSTELQISRSEAARLPAGSGGGFAGPVANFWTGVLTARAAAGPFNQPPYDHTGQAIKGGDEISAMLRQQGKIQKQFSGLISGKGEPYWELLEVDNKAVLTLGASFNRQTGGGSIQAADVLYYASGGYYAAVTLHQMWPVQVDGQPATLIWRGDMISSAEVGDLRGMERMGAESSMMKDVSKAVRLFRRDISGSR
ncbi:MAG: hypothetical protein ABI883_00200 [Chthoniobacterales bacterium]